MRVAAGQFVVTPQWQVNAQTCVKLMQSAAEQGASLLVMPEALLARSDDDPNLSVKSAQPIDGEFMQLLKAQSQCDTLTTILTIHTPSGEGGQIIRWWSCVPVRSLLTTTSCISTMLSPFRSLNTSMQGEIYRR